ncbi:DNA adenine methylase [Serratia sp. TSA_105.2]|uniref:DNA adenine methylase n=1 Tax=Serratia sp. TSA_105.2 TaxID=3415660 RepID=UPI004046AB4A
MPITHSPLRYPGGKTAIFDIVSGIVNENGMSNVTYAEPYAGGAGLALSMLYSGLVNEIYLNDIDRSIWSFWDSVVNNTDEFIEKIISTPVTIDEWHNQKDIQKNKLKSSAIDLGFSTFFLNRTNRSGIIKAGVIGGISQNGNYKLGCRYNKNNLITKIKTISSMRDKISVFNMDANEFINSVSSDENVFLCIDPPYFVKGASLYTNFYEKHDHEILRDTICNISNSWILTYDNAKEIQELYAEKEMFTFNLNYSAGDKKKGEEILIKSTNIKIPNSMIGSRIHAI